MYGWRWRLPSHSSPIHTYNTTIASILVVVFHTSLDPLVFVGCFFLLLPRGTNESKCHGCFVGLMHSTNSAKAPMRTKNTDSCQWTHVFLIDEWTRRETGIDSFLPAAQCQYPSWLWRSLKDLDLVISSLVLGIWTLIISVIIFLGLHQ